MRTRRHLGFALALIGGALLSGAFDVTAGASLQFTSEFPSYTVSPDGSTQASVKLYLSETDGTQLSSGGGLNSVGFEVVLVSPPPTPPALFSITENTQFTGSIVKNLGAGSLYEEFPNLTSGVMPDGLNRVFLGTFVYTGSAGVSDATFTIRDKAGTDTFTAQGSNLDALIAPGQFSVVVPEPGAMLTLSLLIPLCARRRR